MRRALLIVCLLLGTSSASSHGQQGPDVIVEGQRDDQRLQGGKWQISLSRSYHIGRIENWEQSRPTGTERRWDFCLADTDLDPLLRALVGEGRSTSSSTTICSPIHARIDAGRLHATQLCRGGNITTDDPETGRPKTQPAKNMLTVSGAYSKTSLKIDFQDIRQPVTPDRLSILNPDRARWSIMGKRMGDCEVTGQRDAPAE